MKGTSDGGRGSRRLQAGTSMKAGTVAALKADYARKPVAGRAPYLQIHGTDDALELHDASDVGPC